MYGTNGAPHPHSPKIVVYPAMDLFEPFTGTAAELLQSLLSKCELLADQNGEGKEKFFKWFSSVSTAAGNLFVLAFYGKAVYGGRAEASSDIDVLCFISDRSSFRETEQMAQVLMETKVPKFIHTHFLYGHGTPIDTVSNWKRFCVVNSLLVLPEPDDSFRESVELGRKLVLESPFFEGGLGELITYAAYKVLQGKETHYFEPDKRVLLTKPFFVSEFGFELAPLHPAEFNKDVRSELRTKFDDDDLRAIAIAAMRRIRVKKEKQVELADQFVRTLRPHH